MPVYPKKDAYLRRQRRRRLFMRRILALVVICVIAVLCVAAIIAVKNALRPGAGSASSEAVAAVSSGESPSSSSAHSGASSSAASSAASSRISSASVSSSSQTGSSQPAVTHVSFALAAKPIWIEVSIAKQRVFIYDAKNRIINEYVCSTGLPGHDTPTGTFTVKDHGKRFFSEKYQEGGYYWLKFYGNYWIHSIVFDKNEKIIPAEAAKLGTEASHGCVRVAIANAEWMYDNIVIGTKVVVK
ncbi:MAG: L,D-transpeptidase [Clostridia bacterium]|nr:L,D-transpeptidase [Clostridia bacterium]